MIRTLLILLGILTLLALTLAGVAHDSGTASLQWLNYRVDTSAIAAVILIGILALCAVSFWNLALWLARSPQRAERARAEARRRQGDEALTRGFMAVATGDGAEARRLAVKALDLSDNVVLVRILNARAAETAGDTVAAKAAWSAMLGVPELKLAGLKGLMDMAERSGDKVEAVRLATEAYSQARPFMWSFRTLFDARLAAGEWTGALDLIEGALQRKLISPIFSERAKASLMAATAAAQEAAEEQSVRDQALDYAVRAAKLQPQFTPAAVIAARLLARANKLGRAEDVLEAAWAAQPHPAIWMAYRDLVSDETPKERARRLQGLIDRNPKHRESRLLQLERALLGGAKPEIAAALAGLEEDSNEERITRRVGGLVARGAQALGDIDTARMWVSRAGQARGEPDWSDIDADGRAFAYSASDWSALILTFAETGKLSHPRHERAEAGLPDVPELTSRYAPSMPFIKSRPRPVRTFPQIPAPDDVGQYDAAITGQDLDESYESGNAKPRPRPKRAPKPGK